MNDTRTPSGFHSLWCTYVVRGAGLSTSSNNYNPSFELHESKKSYRSATTQIESLSVGDCDFWVALRRPHQQHNIFETCISNKQMQSQIRKVHHYMQCPTLIPALFPPSVSVLPAQLTCVHLVLRGCRTIESCSIVLFLICWLIQDDWRSQRNSFSIYNLNEF